MVDIKHPKCIKCKSKRPNFNYEGETKGLYCKDCAKPNMIDIKTNKCIECKKKHPVFNYKNEKKPMYCKDCKKPDMIDIKNLKCIECKKKIPSFNKKGEIKGLYCKDCAKPDMINVKNLKCVNCKLKQPCFNYEGEEKPLYCKDCSNVSMVDVKNPKCIKCKKRQPSFNYERETKPLYCKDCSETDMIDIKSKMCKSKWCNTHVKNKYKGYCTYCFFNLYPDSPLVRNYKTKEKSVVDFIKENFEDYEWINDKTIDGGCSKRRPDMILDFGSHIIIIEIDENAHTDYDCSCENKRLMEISKDLGHRPIVFIRFNPDSYTNKDRKKIKSCWSLNKTSGLLKINNQKQWKYRLECLKDQVEYWIENETEKTIEIIQLFYDEN